MVVHAGGGGHEIDDLNLDGAGVERDERGVRVNEFLQSVSNPAVYAAGDAASSGGPPLTPGAGFEGTIVSANFLKGKKPKPNYIAIPPLFFPIPPLPSPASIQPH